MVAGNLMVFKEIFDLTQKPAGKFFAIV